MEIIYKDYKLVPSDNAPGKFDLSTTKIRTRKNSEETYEVDDTIGYGYTLPVAIEKIIHLEIQKINETFELKTYLKQFSELKNEVLKNFEEVLTIKN